MLIDITQDGSFFSSVPIGVPKDRAATAWVAKKKGLSFCPAAALL